MVIEIVICFHHSCWYRWIGTLAVVYGLFTQWLTQIEMHYKKNLCTGSAYGTSVHSYSSDPKSPSSWHSRDAIVACTIKGLKEICQFRVYIFGLWRACLTIQSCNIGFLTVLNPIYLLLGTCQNMFIKPTLSWESHTIPLLSVLKKSLLAVTIRITASY